MDGVYGTMNRTLDRAMQYTDAQSLYAGIDDGQVSKDQMELIRRTNPNIYEDYKKYQDEQFKLAMINGDGLSTKSLLTDTIDTNTLFARYGLDMKSSPDIDLVQKRLELMATGEYAKAQTEYMSKTAEYQKMQDTMMNIEAETRKQYEGT